MAIILDRVLKVHSLVKLSFSSTCTYPRLSNYVKRTLHTQTRVQSNYEGDGKTTVAILNKDHKHLIMIDSISSFGFRLNNGMFVVGPLAVFPKSVLQWNAGTVHDINLKSLSLFYLLEPKLDILVVGTGEKHYQINPELQIAFQKKKIALEVLSTEHACSTFNYLNAENRCVAAAILPPENVYVSPDDLKLIKEDPRIEIFGIVPEGKKPKR